MAKKQQSLKPLIVYILGSIVISALIFKLFPLLFGGILDLSDASAGSIVFALIFVSPAVFITIPSTLVYLDRSNSDSIMTSFKLIQIFCIIYAILALLSRVFAEFATKDQIFYERLATGITYLFLIPTIGTPLLYFFSTKK